MLSQLSLLGVLLPIFRLTAALPSPTAIPAAEPLAGPAPTAAPKPPYMLGSTLAIAAEQLELLQAVDPTPSRPGMSKRQNSVLESKCGANYVSCGTSGVGATYCCPSGEICFLDDGEYRCREGGASSSGEINSLISSFNALVVSYATYYSELGMSVPTLAPYNSVDSVNYEDYISSYLNILDSLTATTPTNDQFQTFTEPLPTLITASKSASAAASLHTGDDDDDDDDDDKPQTSVGQIIGIAVGATVIVGAIISAAVFFVVRSRKRKRMNGPGGQSQYGGNNGPGYVMPTGYNQVSNPQQGYSGQGGYSADGKTYYDPAQNYQLHNRPQAGTRPLSFASELGGVEIGPKLGSDQPPTSFAAELDGSVPPPAKR